MAEMSSIERKRESIKAAYKSARWHIRVDAMNDAQVIAVYFSLQKQGKV